MKLFTYESDSISFQDKLFDYRQNKYCKGKMKNHFKKLSLNFINPRRSFIIYIDFGYLDNLEIYECHLNNYNHPSEEESSKHIKRWIKRQRKKTE